MTIARAISNSFSPSSLLPPTKKVEVIKYCEKCILYSIPHERDKERKRDWLMKRRGAKRSSNKMKGTLGKHFQVQFHHHQSSSTTSSSIFTRNLLDFGSQDDPSTSVPDLDAADDKDFILSQDFFW